MDKDIRERLSSDKAENVNNRSVHTWTLFEDHPELGFIEIQWLEEYRERRKEIIRQRIRDAESRGETLSNNQLGKEEETVLNKNTIAPIRSLLRQHLHWHPFKFRSKMPPLDNDSPLTPRFV